LDSTVPIRKSDAFYDLQYVPNSNAEHRSGGLKHVLLGNPHILSKRLRSRVNKTVDFVQPCPEKRFFGIDDSGKRFLSGRKINPDSDICQPKIAYGGVLAGVTV
jgi:hypothetical protein